MWEKLQIEMDELSKATLACVIAKWILVGNKKVGEVVPIWSKRITLDSTWQAITTLVGDYFMDMASGSFWLMLWMKLMGANAVKAPE